MKIALTKAAIKALDKFIKAGRTVDAQKKFKSSVDQVKFTQANLKYIANKTGDDITKLSDKTGLPKVPFGMKREGYTPGKETRKKLSEAAQAYRAEEGFAASPSLPTYERMLRNLSSSLGVPYRKAKQSPNVLGSLQLKRAERMFNPGANTPDELLMAQYGYTPRDFQKIVNQRAQLVEDMKSQGIFSLLDKLGILRPGSRAGSIGHTIPMRQVKKRLGDFVFTPTDDILSTVNNPRYLAAEPNFLNQAKAGIESFLYSPKNLAKNRNLKAISDILEEAQLTSRIYSPYSSNIRTLGTKGEVDARQLKRYLQKLIDEDPWGGKFLPSAKYLRQNFAVGGIANIGAKILPKLAKKLSEKELKLVMETLFKGTKPLMGPKYKRQMKLAKYLRDKYGKETTWPFVKSEVPGPKSSLQRMQEKEFFDNTEFWPDMTQASKVVKFPSAGAVEDIYRSGRLADRKWEQEMLKKLNLAENTELKYPFLNPENNAFIVTGPRTSLGRYQMSGIMDTEAASPVSKYAVYDWWDDVLKQMRKKPKFKYVKDDKGNTIMKKVK